MCEMCGKERVLRFRGLCWSLECAIRRGNVEGEEEEGGGRVDKVRGRIRRRVGRRRHGVGRGIAGVKRRDVMGIRGGVGKRSGGGEGRDGGRGRGEGSTRKVVEDVGAEIEMIEEDEEEAGGNEDVGKTRAAPRRSSRKRTCRQTGR